LPGALRFRVEAAAAVGYARRLEDTTMSIRFVALETALVRRLRDGGPDANGQTPERGVTPADGYPCRHCLGPIGKGEPYLTLALRPFPAPQPYAEIGPVFLHAGDCPRGGGDAGIPGFLDSPRYMVRGYGADDRIVYGTGTIEATQDIPAAAAEKFLNPSVRYLHVRSASNNCYHCRIERA
jgi:hypothetical protein